LSSSTLFMPTCLLAKRSNLDPDFDCEAGDYAPDKAIIIPGPSDGLPADLDRFHVIHHCPQAKVGVRLWGRRLRHRHRYNMGRPHRGHTRMACFTAFIPALITTGDGGMALRITPRIRAAAAAAAARDEASATSRGTARSGSSIEEYVCVGYTRE